MTRDEFKDWYDTLLTYVDHGEIAIDDIVEKVRNEVDQAEIPSFIQQLARSEKDPAAPFGPLMGLGLGDPATIRQVLRKIGVDRLVITPEGDGWRFAGPADFTGLVHGRVKAGPQAPNRSEAPRRSRGAPRSCGWARI